MAPTDVLRPLSPAERKASSSSRGPGRRRQLGLFVLAVVLFVAAVSVLGPLGLIPYGLLLAFSADNDEKARRSVRPTRWNLALAAAMMATFAVFWLAYLALPPSTIVAVAGALIALPLVLQESADEVAQARTVVVTKRSLILTLWGVVIFVYLYQERGVWLFGLAAVCVILPIALAVSRAWSAHRGRVETGLLRHPLRRDLRPHLLQALNIWLCCALLGGILAAGGTHWARIGYSLDAAQFAAVFTVFIVGAVLLAVLALVPRRRVSAASNVAVALLSGFLAVQLFQTSSSPTDPIALDSPLTGEWYVFNGGPSALLNGHATSEGNAIDFAQLGENGRTHTGGADAPLDDYAGFGSPVLSPADGRVASVANDYPDNPVGTNGDRANHVLIDIGGDRYVMMAHVRQGSVMVEVGDVVQRGQLLAEVGNNGHSSEPHLHLQVQDSLAEMDAERTYPMVFRDVYITRGGAWPWGDSGALRTGDLVRPIKP